MCVGWSRDHVCFLCAWRCSKWDHTVKQVSVGCTSLIPVSVKLKTRDLGPSSLEPSKAISKISNCFLGRFDMIDLSTYCSYHGQFPSHTSREDVDSLQSHVRQTEWYAHQLSDILWHRTCDSVLWIQMSYAVFARHIDSRLNCAWVSLSIRKIYRGCYRPQMDKPRAKRLGKSPAFFFYLHPLPACLGLKKSPWSRLGKTKKKTLDLELHPSRAQNKGVFPCRSGCNLLIHTAASDKHGRKSWGRCSRVKGQCVDVLDLVGELVWDFGWSEARGEEREREDGDSRGYRLSI